jgi:hypothetical protein
MITHRRSSVLRKQRGQALAESAAGVLIFAFLFMVITPFAINYFFFTSYYSRLEQVAAETAKAYETNLAKGQDADTAAGNASDLANTLSGALSLPTNNLSVSFSDQKTYVLCTASDSMVPPCLSTAFGSLFNMTAKGVAIGNAGSGGTTTSNGNAVGYWELCINGGAIALVPIAKIMDAPPGQVAITSYNGLTCFGGVNSYTDDNGVSSSSTYLNILGAPIPAGTTVLAQ